MLPALFTAATGMRTQQPHIDVSAHNLANVNTSRTAEGRTYQPMQLISGPKVSFKQAMADKSATGLSGVEIYGIEAQRRGTRRVHQPSHPHADNDGFVTMPDIDHAGEMTNMIKTSRIYEANLTALSVAMQMYSRALELGRQV